MILHVTAGSTPVEVYVHGEAGAAEHLSIGPHAAAPADAPAATDGSRRWLLAMAALVALVSGGAGYRLGAAPSGEPRRDAAYREDGRAPQRPLPAYVPEAPQAAEVPTAVARALAQPPVVTPPPAAVPTTNQPRAGSGGPRNPFGLE